MEHAPFPRPLPRAHVAAPHPSRSPAPRRRLGAGLACALVVAGIPLAAVAQVVGPLLRVVAVTGDPSPDGNGLFNFFQQPSINDQGDISFACTFSGSLDVAGIVVERTTGLEVVARSGDPAPDGNGVLSSFGLGPVPINASGRVAFTAALSGTLGGFTDTPRIFTSDGLLLRQVVRRGQAAPDGNGTFDGFDVLGIEDDGEASFFATFADTAGGFTIDDRGVYRGDGIADPLPAPLDEIVRSGELVGGNVWFAGNVDPLTMASHPEGWVAVGPFVSSVSNPSTMSQLLVLDDGAQSSIELTLGDASPDGDGTIVDFGTPFVARDGRVATNVQFVGSDQGGLDDRGIVSFDPLGGDRVLVREGDTAPGGETFTVDFVDAAGFASTRPDPNRFVFHGFLNGAAGGSAADEGLFLARDDQLFEVVREGDPTPEPDGDFDLLRLNQAHVNVAGTVAFFARVRNASSLGDGIFRWTPDSGLATLARVGEPLLGSTIQAVFFADDLDARRAGVSPLNGVGEVTFRVRLQDGRQAILATNAVPEPVNGLGFGTLFLAVLAARRRIGKERRETPRGVRRARLVAPGAMLLLVAGGLSAVWPCLAAGSGDGAEGHAEAIVPDEREGTRGSRAESETAGDFLFVGPIEDGDGDLVPFSFDNCTLIANGPNERSDQVDTDLDGYGNACDADCDQDGLVTAADFACFLSCFGDTCPFSDHDGDGQVTTADFGIFLGQFGGPPGPSGLACADPTLVVPPAAPCLP